ncbi:YmfQ family protein [Otariodibacter oris]|uniref:Uncharacterized protein YmfQ (DUF2313 family) n=1 Tax=Otariodibacter oris TaxID=1032623 RepID=A0A420XIK1_9PAST|nr:putative phage tail protein [Otariodibacter oris]QGM80653.1 phage tail protein [Otariodibacter oris]RKR77187.1 uncharacterized protein YmfQ (DUF2313 family) [Otariodibacter oris]
MSSIHARSLIKLLPPVSYNISGDNIHQSLEVDGRALDVSFLSAKKTLDGLNPLTGVFISEWERVLGIKNNTQSIEVRIDRVIAKLNDLGGLSIEYITKKAAELGYDIEIKEPTPFISGVSHAGDMLWHKDIIWTFFVNVNTQTDSYKRFRAGISQAGDALMGRFFDPVLELLLEELKPAFSRCWIRYLGEF